MNNTYLIPANSKKSLLKFGIFNTVDLWIFVIGIVVSFGLMMIMPVQNFWMGLLAISPGLICSFLILPVPNYHNIRTVIMNAWIFYTTRQRYIWRGWCFNDGDGDKK